MNFNHSSRIGFMLMGVLVFAAVGGAQEKAQAVTPRTGTLNSYDAARENVLQGTVIAYAATSATPPLGPHVTVRTSSGVVDVHVGNGKLLDANHLTLQLGDTVRITGETIAFGDSTIFVARVVAKGSQSVALRSIQGSPLVSLSRNAAQQGGVR